MSELTPVQLLAIGAHPDDVEYGMGGTLVRHHRLGYRIGVVDLTRGELGSKGTPEGRAEEARHAAAVYGARWRITLDLGDNRVGEDPSAARRLAGVIRAARPSLVFTHHQDDRHPDHRAAHELVRRAVFASALRNLDLSAPHHVPDAVLYFPSDTVVVPDVLVDVSDVWADRVETMRRFTSQFAGPTLEIDHRYYGVTDHLELVAARAQTYGQRIGVRFAEAFLTSRPPAVTDLVALLTGTSEVARVGTDPEHRPAPQPPM
jgi:N-acetylglucosamine malate deacetylase 1